MDSRNQIAAHRSLHMPDPIIPAETISSDSAALPSRITDALRRAEAHRVKGRGQETLAAYDEVLAILPDHAETLLNRGVILRMMGKREEALASYWRALQTGVDWPILWQNAANALIDMNRLPEARSAVEALLRRAPLSPDGWQLLGALAARHGAETTAEVCLSRALALAPRNEGILCRLAALMSQRGALTNARRLFADAQKIGPLSPTTHSGYAQTLISEGHLDEAERHLRRALELDVDQLDAHLGLARLLLLKGELETGWVEYEWRRRKPESQLPKLPGQEWDGSPLKDKTILVYSEQGLGDVIQFARYIPLLAQVGAKVHFVVPRPLYRLMQGLPGVTELLTDLRPTITFDFHVPLLSIPKLMGISLKTVPAQIPYLRLASTAKLPVPAGTRIKVGIVWAGSPKHVNDRHRSIDLDSFLSLASVNGVTLYSLQAGPRASDVVKQAHPALIIDLSPHLKDFAETAAIVSQLDLVVCVDTSVAHLAGALGKPVWMLTPFSPDWRWLLERKDSPWYPTMQLYRQSEPTRWDDVMGRIVADLKSITAKRPDVSDHGEFMVNAIFPRVDGSPRYRMPVPRVFMNDPGVRYLVTHERMGAGYEYATRSFIDAHLEPGDLFLDIGAHWGIMALHAVTRWPNNVTAIACEPLPLNLPHLRRWVGDNGLADVIEVVAAAVSNESGRGGLRPESTMGHSLVKTPDGQIPVVTIDDMLAERPALADRRVIVKIDVEGSEPDVVDGMSALLASGRVAVIIWERGTSYQGPEGKNRILALRARLAGLGYTAWRFESEDRAGAMIPFVEDGWDGNVFELAPGLAPHPAYGEPRPASVAQPDDPILAAAQQATQFLNEGAQLQKANKIDQALALYAKASMLERRLPDLYNNLGVAMRTVSRLAASEAAYRRATAINRQRPGTLSNLANVLREAGKLDEAEQVHKNALAQAPDDSRLLYNYGLLKRDVGSPVEAQKIFEQTLQLDPTNNECRWDHALSLLQQGDYATGFPAYETRWGLARCPSRNIALPRWTGEPLEGRTIFLHDEQGFGDVLQWARFIPEVRKRGAGRIILECQPELLRLMALAPEVDALVQRGQAIPDADVYAPLLSLPGLFGTTLETLPRTVPYLRAPEPSLPVPSDDRLKMGLVWAGKPTPRDRSCPLQTLLPVLGDPRFSVLSLQAGPPAADLKALGTQGLITDLGPRLHDFAETAAIMSKLDILVTIDTSVAHLAGALGIRTCLLLLYASDWRWFDRGTDSPWYPSLRLFRQDQPNQWERALDDLANYLDDFASERKGPLPSPNNLR